MSADASSTSRYGFTALPAAASALKPATNSPKPIPIESIPAPTSALAERIAGYARFKLSKDTFNHSMRVYHYGLAIAGQCFPDWNLTPGSKLEETWFLTAILHDIGTADGFLDGTKLSFEFWGGMHAHRILLEPEMTTAEGDDGPEDDSTAEVEQAESVMEAILRHQDIQDKGKVTMMTQLIQLATILDNVGGNAEMIHRETIGDVVKEWPRTGWSGCFKEVVQREKEIKPWAMVSRIEGFEDMIMNNKAMKEWE
jgi:cyanamide hydratase